MAMNWILISSLQIFAEGGDGVGGSDTGVMAGDAAPQKGSGVKKPSGISGGAPSDAGMGWGSESQTKDRDGEFERLIKGEYKDSYNRRVQEIIQKRLKDARQTEGVPEGIPETGNAGDLAESQEVQRGVDRVYGDWIRQAEKAQKTYPGLDLRREVKDPAFLGLLRAGAEVGDAYFVRHREDILPALLHHTAKMVEQKLAGKIRTEGIRPGENGLRSQGTALTKTDVTKLSKADRDEIRRRVAKGERIRF